MKNKMLLILLIFLCLIPFAFADPVLFDDDFSGKTTVPYDSDDTASFSYTFEWHYPHLIENDEFSIAVNSFYQFSIDDEKNFGIPIKADSLRGYKEDSSETVSYIITCNNDIYLSFLLERTESISGHTSSTYQGHTFSKMNIKPGSTIALPFLLGILENNDNDEWLETRQTEKADNIVRKLVWEKLTDESLDIDLYQGLDFDMFSTIFFPEEDFVLNESGNPVFFILPGYISPEEEGLIRVEIDLEDILDEM